MTHLLVPSLQQERRHQLIDALSKSQRTRCVPTLKTRSTLRTRSAQALPLQADTFCSSRQPTDAYSPRENVSGMDSPIHGCGHSSSQHQLSCSWIEDASVPKQAQSARLPGQVLASTKSRTCAASHFQAFKLNLKGRDGREARLPRKSWGEESQKESPASKDKAESSTAPRLPGRVLEDTLSRTCAAAFLTHEVRSKPQVPCTKDTKDIKGKKEAKENTSVEPKVSMTPRMTPRPVKDIKDRAIHKGLEAQGESPRQSAPLSARKYSPTRKVINKAFVDRAASLQERLPRPTLPSPISVPVTPALPASARRKTIAATEYREYPTTLQTRPVLHDMHPQQPQVLTGALPQRTAPHASHAIQEPKPILFSRPPLQSEPDPEATESRSIRAGTPSLPIPLGATLPSWARTEAGLSPFQKKLAYSAATRLQRAFRKWWFRNFSSSGPMGFRALRDAVIYLQRWWRLAHARRVQRLRLRRMWKQISFRMLVLQDAAVYVQRGWHMVKVQRFRWAAQLAAKMIQRNWRRHYLLLQKERQRFGMAKLCSWRRRCLAKTKLIAGIWKFWRVQHEAAVCVQSVWRGRETRRMFEESRERLERARDRREIIRRKAQLLETKPIAQTFGSTGSKPSKTFKVNPFPSFPEHAERSERNQLTQSDRRADGHLGPDQDRQDRCQDRAPFRPSGAVDDLFQKLASGGANGANNAARDGRDGRGMQSRSKRLSYGQTRVDTAAHATPRSTHQRAAPSGTVSMTTFLASQNALSATQRAERAAPCPQSLIKDLVARGCLSTLPRLSPFSPELSGHSDLEAVRNWLSGALPSWRLLQVLRVECSGAAAAAYNGVSRTLGPERLLWHGTSWDCVANIAQNGFNRAYGGRHGSKLGRGSYFAEEATFALRFCGRSQHRAIFLAGVLPGRFCRGAEGLVEPPALDAGTRYDSTVDDPANPKVFCVFRDFQAIPLYLAEVASN